MSSLRAETMQNSPLYLQGPAQHLEQNGTLNISLNKQINEYMSKYQR